MNIYTIYAQIFKIWRQKRMDLFESIIQPDEEDLVLDVGGYPATWTSRPQLTKRIDCLNLHTLSWDPSAEPDYRITTSIGDGCELSYEDASYDIVFSNSVIEHVGDWKRQQAFAREVRRVGKRLWIQTPAYECPLEPQSRSEEHTSELQSRGHLVCRLLLEQQNTHKGVKGAAIRGGQRTDDYR